MTKLTVVFRNVAYAPRTSYIVREIIAIPRPM